MEIESSNPQEEVKQTATRNQKNEPSTQANKIAKDYPQKKKCNYSKIKFKKNSVVIITAAVTLTLLLVIGKMLILSSKNQIQSSNQAETQTACTKSTKSPNKERTTPDFLESDCEFRTYPGVQITELDKKSCKRISRYYIVDKNNVYKQLYEGGSSDIADYIIIKEADASSFKSLNHGYFRDSKNLFNDAPKSYRIIRNIDLETLQVLSTHYLKDKNSVYFSQLYNLPETTKYADKLTTLRGFDVETFEIVQNDRNHEQYFKDKNGVYYNQELPLDAQTSKIKRADATSFEVLDSYLMAKDKYNVYHEGEIVDVTDPETFVVLKRGLFKDDVGVYTQYGEGGVFSRYPNMDGCSYELINYDNSYSWKGYSKDKNNVYYRDAIVEGADPDSFRVVGDKAFDKNYEYQGIYRVNK